MEQESRAEKRTKMEGANMVQQGKRGKEKGAEKVEPKRERE